MLFNQCSQIYVIAVSTSIKAVISCVVTIYVVLCSFGAIISWILSFSEVMKFSVTFLPIQIFSPLIILLYLYTSATQQVPKILKILLNCNFLIFYFHKHLSNENQILKGLYHYDSIKIKSNIIYGILVLKFKNVTFTSHKRQLQVIFIFPVCFLFVILSNCYICKKYFYFLRISRVIKRINMSCLHIPAHKIFAWNSVNKMSCFKTAIYNSKQVYIKF